MWKIYELIIENRGEKGTLALTGNQEVNVCLVYLRSSRATFTVKSHLKKYESSRTCSSDIQDQIPTYHYHKYIYILNIYILIYYILSTYFVYYIYVQTNILLYIYNILYISLKFTYMYYGVWKEKEQQEGMNGFLTCSLKECPWQTDFLHNAGSSKDSPTLR